MTRVEHGHGEVARRLRAIQSKGRKFGKASANYLVRGFRKWGYALCWLLLPLHPAEAGAEATPAAPEEAAAEPAPEPGRKSKRRGRPKGKKERINKSLAERSAFQIRTGMDVQVAYAKRGPEWSTRIYMQKAEIWVPTRASRMQHWALVLPQRWERVFPRVLGQLFPALQRYYDIPVAGDVFPKQIIWPRKNSCTFFLTADHWDLALKG